MATGHQKSPILEEAAAPIRWIICASYSSWVSSEPQLHASPHKQVPSPHHFSPQLLLSPRNPPLQMAGIWVTMIAIAAGMMCRVAASATITAAGWATAAVGGTPHTGSPWAHRGGHASQQGRRTIILHPLNLAAGVTRSAPVSDLTPSLCRPPHLAHLSGVGASSPTKTPTQAHGKVITVGNRTFHVYDATLSWGAARQKCQAFGSDLASIHNADENTAVWNLVGARAWIGFTDSASEGTWKWSDGSSSTYANWGSAEPNNMGSVGEHCAEMGPRWNDMPCASALINKYVCAAAVSSAPTTTPTAAPTSAPTSVPTSTPSSAPTPPLCSGNSHQCDKGAGSICYQCGATCTGYFCGCKQGYECVAGCNGDHTGHTCQMAAAPTKAPTAVPSSAPSIVPTAVPTYHACDQGTHSCYKGRGGACYKIFAEFYFCACTTGYHCTAGCSSPFPGHTCNTTATSVPSKVPTSPPAREQDATAVTQTVTFAGHRRSVHR
jgi:hypothetical protein